jgi:hypothetical protein
MKLVWETRRHQMVAGCLPRLGTFLPLASAMLNLRPAYLVTAFRAIAYRRGLTTVKIKACQQVTGLSDHKMMLQPVSANLAKVTFAPNRSLMGQVRYIYETTSLF